MDFTSATNFFLNKEATCLSEHIFIHILRSIHGHVIIYALFLLNRIDFELLFNQSGVLIVIVKLQDSTQLAGCTDQLAQWCIKGHRSSDLIRIAVAGNEKVACKALHTLRSEVLKIESKLIGTLVFCTGANDIKQYNSLQEHIEQKPGQNLGHFEDIIQLEANQTTFTALTQSGQVWTWGDGRYEACLGREVSDEW
jgi:alpha-tubulin suppressor-like RCC1 family protein